MKSRKLKALRRLEKRATAEVKKYYVARYGKGADPKSRLDLLIRMGLTTRHLFSDGRFFLKRFKQLNKDIKTK